MNDKKFCFIYCVNDQLQLQRSLDTLKLLKVPAGYQIEHIFIDDASSMTSGYNNAMKKTDTKYKVYLHQDVFILNHNFLMDILSLFGKFPIVGMLGVVGTKSLPENGVWWEGKEKYGKVLESSPGKMRLLSFSEVSRDYESVKAIDGLMIVLNMIFLGEKIYLSLGIFMIFLNVWSSKRQGMKLGFRNKMNRG